MDLDPINISPPPAGTTLTFVGRGVRGMLTEEGVLLSLVPEHSLFQAQVLHGLSNIQLPQ